MRGTWCTRARLHLCRIISSACMVWTVVRQGLLGASYTTRAPREDPKSPDDYSLGSDVAAIKKRGPSTFGGRSGTVSRPT